MRLTRRLGPLFCGIGILFALGLPGGNATAKDLEDILEDVASQFEISTGWDYHFFGFSVNPPGIRFDSLSDFNARIVNDRVIPLSSTVTGFTYQYNEDLDIYERSSQTFGPLFSERAQTLGAKRFQLGLSYSFLEFDEFEGTSLSALPASEVQERLDLTEQSGSSTPLAGSVLNLIDTNQVDVIYDLDIEEQVSSFYVTYGLTDRIDLGLVVPVVQIDFEAQATTRTSQTGDLKPCSQVSEFSFEVCDAAGNTSVRESENYLGIGDLVLRGKWNFLDHRMPGVGTRLGFDSALLLNATIPTGSTENLTGFATMTFRPALVFSRDFTSQQFGGIGLHGFLGYDWRPDISENSEVEWGIGFAAQPFGRASFNVDVLGSERVSNEDFSESRHDLSVGTKFMLRSNALVDLNVVLPLNDDGLRPNIIYTAQLEWLFGD